MKRKRAQKIVADMTPEEQVHIVDRYLQQIIDNTQLIDANNNMIMILKDRIDNLVRHVEVLSDSLIELQ